METAIEIATIPHNSLNYSTNVCIYGCIMAEIFYSLPAKPCNMTKCEPVLAMMHVFELH